MSVFKNFLQGVDSEAMVCVFLVNGVKLNGSIVEYGDDGIVLLRHDSSQFVNIKAIATIMPFAPSNAGC